MPGIIEKKRQIRMESPNRFDFERRNVKIFRPEVQHDRAAGRFAGVVGDWAPEITHSRSAIEPCGGEPSESSTETVTQHAYFRVARHLARTRDCGRDIDQGCIDADLLRDLHSPGRIRGLVGEFEIFLYAVEQRRGNRPESLRGIIVDNGADMAVHTEDFPNRHDCGPS